MKIYLFDAETGFYVGEDFANGPDVAGANVVPPDATTIAPPPCGPGQLPVFDPVRKVWRIRSMSGAALGSDHGE